MTVSRRTLNSVLSDRHFGNGAPTWPVGRGKSWARRSETFAEADLRRQQRIIKLNWLGNHHNHAVAQQLTRTLGRCCGPKRCKSGACPVCVRAVQRLCVEVGVELDRKERQLP